jgi:hypothetical protein
MMFVKVFLIKTAALLRKLHVMSKKTVKTYEKTGASGIMSLIQKPKPV